MSERNKLTEFTNNLDPKMVEVVKRLAEIVSSVDDRLIADIKWRQLTFALLGDFHHWICAIAVTKKSVNLLFHFGGLLDDPDKVLIAGTSKFLRKMEFKAIDDINQSQITDFVSQAIGKLAYFKDNWRTLNK